MTSRQRKLLEQIVRSPEPKPFENWLANDLYALEEDGLIGVSPPRGTRLGPDGLLAYPVLQADQ